MHLFVALAPFALAVFMAALAPDLSGAVRDRVTGVVREAGTRVKAGSPGPPHTSAEYVGDYVEYAADAAQTVPSLLLPLVGAFLVLQGNPLTVSTILLLVLVVPGCLYIFLRVLRTDPLTYVARKYLHARYAVLPLAAATVNIVSGIVVTIIVVGSPAPS